MAYLPPRFGNCIQLQCNHWIQSHVAASEMQEYYLCQNALLHYVWILCMITLVSCLMAYVKSIEP